MVTPQVSVNVQHGKVIVKYEGETIRELTREKAIECGGEIAEAGKKIPKGNSVTSDESEQETNVTSDESEQETNVTSDESEQEIEGDAIDVATVSELSEDEIYIGVVDRVSSSGNAIVELPPEIHRNHVNLGPIEESSVGKEVEFKYVGASWGECLIEEYIYESYSPRDGMSSSSTSSSGTQKSFSNNPFSTGDTNLKDPDNKNKLINGHL